MTTANILNSMSGWAIANKFTRNKRSEDEIKQGGNHVFPVPNQLNEIYVVSDLSTRLCKYIPNPFLRTSAEIICVFAPIIASPFISLSASIKQGSYATTKTMWNTSRYSIINTGTGHVIRGALAITAFTIGGFLFTLPVYLYAGYSLLDYSGYLPGVITRRVNEYGPSALLSERFYEQIVNYLNEKLELPEELTSRQITISTKIADMTGIICRNILVIETIAMMCLGNIYFGIPFFFSLGFEYLDAKGKLPRKICLYMEKYSPAISALGLALQGSMFTKVLRGTEFILYASPSLNRKFQHIVSSFIRTKLEDLRRANETENMRPTNEIFGPKLEDVDAPVVINRELSFEQINAILDTPEEQNEQSLGSIIQGLMGSRALIETPAYEINPAHCSKMCDSHLPRDNDFGKFATYFETYFAEENLQRDAHYINRKLKDDDRFIDMFAEKFEVTDKELIKRNFDSYIQRAATEENLTPEAYAARWLKEQNMILVQVLKGERRPPGFLQDLEIASNNAEKILAYINTLNVDSARNRVEIQDLLIKLSIEGGAYCSRGIRRATGELIDGIIGSGTENLTPREIYEINLNNQLYQTRLLLGQCSSQIGMQLIETFFPSRLAQDVHMQDMYRRQLALGFVPLYDFERHNLGITSIGIWNFLGRYQQMMYNTYDPESIFHGPQALQELAFATYIREVIESNTQLTQEQKETIIEKYTLMNPRPDPEDPEDFVAQWTLEETQRRFHRLAFVMLGVLRKKEENTEAVNQNPEPTTATS